MKGNKLNILFILFILSLFTKLGAQNLWNRSNPDNSYEVGSLLVSNKGEYFIGLLNNYEVFYSSDFGNNWIDVSSKNSKITDSYLDINNKLFSANDEIYFSTWKKTFKYFKNSFSILNDRAGTNNNWVFNKSGSCFFVNYKGVFATDTNWNVNLSNPIWRTSNLNSSIIVSYLYTDEINFICCHSNINNLANDSIIIYKLNTSTGINSVYSKFKASTIQIIVNESGTIYYMQEGNKNVFVSDLSNPNNFSENIIDSSGHLKRIYQMGKSLDEHIYIVGDNGVYFNNDNNRNDWNRVYSMSFNLPLPEKFEQDYNYFFKDSAIALLSFGDNCGESRSYCFSPAYPVWKLIKLPINKKDFLELKTNRLGRIYAYTSCKNLYKRTYRQSDDQGNSWEIMLINGEYVTSLGINKDGEAVAIAGNQIFLHNSELDSWSKVPTSITNNPQLFFQHFYSSGFDLFLDAYSADSKGKRTQFLFNSEDGGITWEQIKAFQLEEAERTPEFDIVVLDNSNWLGYDWTYQDVFLSNDKGKSWNPDPRFKEFKYIDKIVKVSPSDNLILASYYLNKEGTYRHNLINQSIQLLSPYFENKSVKFSINSPSYLLGIYSSDTKPILSKDLGSIIDENDSGLLSNDRQVRYFNDIILDKTNMGLLTIGNDGLYTTQSGIFSGINGLNKDQQYFKFSQINEKVLIELFPSINISSIEMIQIYNIGGQQIYCEHNTSRQIIELDSLVSGVYYLVISMKNRERLISNFLKV